MGRWLAALRSVVGSARLALNERTPYRYSPPELEAFERRMGIELPTAYRVYLRDVGAGFMCGSRVALLDEWCEPEDPADLPANFLQQSFPFTEAWNDMAIHDPTRGWGSPYFDAWHCRGSMRLQGLGCGEYLLMVVSGPERGNLWHDDRALSHLAGGGARGGIFPKTAKGAARVTIDEYLE